MQGALLQILQSTPAQADAIVSTVGSAYEKNVLVGTIILLSIAVVTLFTLLVKSYKDRAKELKETNTTHSQAMLAKSTQVAQDFKDKDDRLYALLERVTLAITQTGHNLNQLTDEIRRPR